VTKGVSESRHQGIKEELREGAVHAWRVPVGHNELKINRRKPYYPSDALLCLQDVFVAMVSRPMAEKVGKTTHKTSVGRKKAPLGQWRRAQWPGSRARGLLHSQAWCP